MESFDLIVIGSGPAGYVAAIRAAQLKMKVACVEKSRTLGGTCLNVGCIPSKALLHSSEYYDRIHKHGKEHGIVFDSLGIDFEQMMKRKRGIVEGFVSGIDALFKKNQVKRYFGSGQLISEHIVEINSEEGLERIEGKNILLATGSEAIALPFLPFDEQKILSSTGALSLSAIPKKLLVVGAGVIGLELGSVYSRLGSEVTVVELLDRVCPTFDLGISKALLNIFQKQGLKFYLSTKVAAGQAKENGVEITIQNKDGQQSLEADAVLVAIGRRPFTKGLGLDKLGIKVDQRGFIVINSQFQTNIANIYAVGDVVEGPMLAHKASEEAVAAVELMAGLNAHINYMAIPNVMYTWPEVATVGLTEEEAKNGGLEIKVGQFPFKANSRARCSGDEEGFVKIIAEAKSERVIGVHIIGPNASEMIGEAAMAIDKKATALNIAQLAHSHPTHSEAIKEAALGVYKRILHL